MNLTNNKLMAFIFICLVLTHSLGFALSSDRQKPMRIKSNKVFIDDKAGLSVYEGQVVVIQGTMKITAQKLTVMYDSDQRLKKIIAIGRPSTYKQRPDKKESDVHAKANKMVYFALKDMLVMTKNASIQRAGGQIKSPKILYYLNEDRVATGKTTTEEGDGSRVNIILDSPKK